MLCDEPQIEGCSCALELKEMIDSSQDGWGYRGGRCEKFHRRGHVSAGSKSIIRSSLGGEVERTVQLEEETKSRSKYTEMRRSS